MCKVFFIRSRLVASVLILLCGGAVYAQQPATRYLSDDIPKAWTPDTLFSQQLPPEDLWWSGFNDACLDTLIQEAVDSNHNLLAAADRIRMARAAWRMEQSGFYPSVNFRPVGRRPVIAVIWGERLPITLIPNMLRVICR